MQVTTLLNLKSKGRPQHQSDTISLRLSQLHCTPSFTSDGFKSNMLV